jgi:hypothetical protein
VFAEIKLTSEIMLTTFEHLQKSFLNSLFKLLVKELFEQKPFFISFHNPTNFLYLVCTLESQPVLYLWLAVNPK